MLYYGQAKFPTVTAYKMLLVMHSLSKSTFLILVLFRLVPTQFYQWNFAPSQG